MRGPLGIVLLPKGDPRGEGVLVASKGKVSLFLDRDRDGKADEEQVVATGWKESFHQVDTVGLAQDPKDGSYYFGLGTQNFADAYVIDKNTGRAQFDIKNTYGTIQRLSVDFSKRETVCTGVRFTCSLAFNPAGDLFATEQEGALQFLADLGAAKLNAFVSNFFFQFSPVQLIQFRQSAFFLRQRSMRNPLGTCLPAPRPRAKPTSSHSRTPTSSFARICGRFVSSSSC